MGTGAEYVKDRFGRYELPVVLGIIGIFVALTSAYYWSPGRIQDTLHNEWYATQLAGWLKEGELLKFLSWGCPLYHGRITSYLMAPFAVLTGPHWGFVRAWPIFFGVLTVWMTFLFARENFGRMPAMCATALLVLHPAFVMGTKVGHHQVSSMVFFSVTAMWAVARWRRFQKNIYLGLSFFLVGLGLGTRLWFAWFAAAFVAAGFGIGLRTRWTARVWLWAIAGLVAGALPIIVTEFAWDFSSFKLILRRIWTYSSEGEPFHRKFSVGNYLKGFNHLLNGNYFYSYFFGDTWTDNIWGKIYPWLMWMGSGSMVAGLRKPERKAAEVWLILIFFAMVFVSVFSSLLWPYPHPIKYFVFYPFPQLWIALGICGIAGKFSRRKTLVAGLLFAFVAVGECTALSSYFRRMAVAGGIGRASDRIYDLADWIKSNAGHGEPIIFFDADALLASRFILAGSGLDLVDETYLSVNWEASESLDRLLLRTEKILASKRRAYVVNDLLSAWTEHPGRFTAVSVWAKSHHHRFVLKNTVREADGRALYEVYSLEKSGIEKP